MIEQEAQEILKTPEWKEYKRVSDLAVQKMEEEFINDPEPLCARTVAAFHRRIEVAVTEMQVFYRDKLHARLELEEQQRVERRLQRTLAREKQLKERQKQVGDHNC